MDDKYNEQYSIFIYFEYNTCVFACTKVLSASSIYFTSLNMLRQLFTYITRLNLIYHSYKTIQMYSFTDKLMIDHIQIDVSSNVDEYIDVIQYAI